MRKITYKVGNSTSSINLSSAKKLRILHSKELESIKSQLPEDIKIPCSIFTADHSPLEALTIYLHLLGKSKSQIAKTLHRDDRTIWLTIHNAQKKGALRVAKSPSIPLWALSFRDISILESAAHYLKTQASYTNSQIAALLNKNQNTIWTVLSRAKAKLNKHTDQARTDIQDLAKNLGLSASQIVEVAYTEKITVPISIFRSNAPLQSLVKFLYDEKLSVSDISHLLKRDVQTIYSTLKKSKPVDTTSEFTLPIGIFCTRRASVLEAAVKYCKKAGMRNIQIAKAMGRDPNTIWTTYERGKNAKHD